MGKNKLRISALFLLVFLSLSGYFIYSVFKHRGSNSPAPTSDQNNAAFHTSQDLKSRNSHYRQGEDLSQAGQYKQAIEEYKAALEEAQSPREISLLKYEIASATDGSGDYLAAIGLMKALAVDDNITRQTRAYAIEGMGKIYYSTHDPKVTEVIFSDYPYKTFLNPNNPKDIGFAYRKLFEYAASYYPLAASELRIAEWYTDEIFKLSRPTNKDLEKHLKIEIYKSIIRKNLELADQDIERIKQDENVAGSLPTLANRKAIIIGKLVRSGDTSFGDPDALFQEAIRLSIANRAQEGFTYYHYATYLAQNFGNARGEDIRKILGKFYENNRYRDTRVFAFFKNERLNKGKPSNVVGDLVLLSKIDPKFKEVLIKLGWKESDFSKAK